MDSQQPLLPDKRESELRIVLLGRLDQGKTSSANTILGKANSEPPKTTEKCCVETGDVHEYKVVVCDTPGLFQPGISNEDIMKEIKKSIKKVEPHVFLIVMEAGEKFTEEVQKTVKTICHTFGKNTMSYSMVLFTYGEELVRKKKSIEDYISGNKNLEQLIMQCHWNYHVFDNEEGKSTQVPELMKKISSMVQRRSKQNYYTAEMLKEAEEDLKRQQQQQQQQQQVEHQKAEGTGATRGPVRTSALLGTGAGCLMGYFFGGGELTSTVGAAVGAVAGGVMASGTTGLAILAKNYIKK